MQLMHAHLSLLCRVSLVTTCSSWPSRAWRWQPSLRRWVAATASLLAVLGACCGAYCCNFASFTLGPGEMANVDFLNINVFSLPRVGAAPATVCLCVPHPHPGGDHPPSHQSPTPTKNLTTHTCHLPAAHLALLTNLRLSHLA